MEFFLLHFPLPQHSTNNTSNNIMLSKMHPLILKILCCCRVKIYFPFFFSLTSSADDKERKKIFFSLHFVRGACTEELEVRCVSFITKMHATNVSVSTFLLHSVVLCLCCVYTYSSLHVPSKICS